MAFSKSPEKETYSTQQVLAACNMDLRPNSLFFGGAGITQDAGMVNLLPIKIRDKNTQKEEIQAVTREPIQAVQVVASNLVNRGCYVWEKSVGTNYYFSVNGTGVYTSTNGVTWALVTTLATNVTTPVRFTEFIDDVSTKKLVLVDGVEGYVFTSNAAGTKITDVDFPSPHIPFPIFLDGYLFIAKASTGDIYNSDLNNPASWTAGSFISSEMYPDDLQALVKINNYILAIGTQGCEFFYDAAIATASPLARYDGGSLPIGTQVPNSIASNKNAVMFISNNSDGENILTMIEDFKSTTVESHFLIPLLNARLSAASNPTTAAGVRGFFFRQHEQLFYGIAFQGNATTVNTQNVAFAFSFETGWWTQLKFQADGSAPFPVYFTTQTSSGQLSTYVSGHVLGAPFFGKMGQDYTASFTGVAADNFSTGSTYNIYVELRTAPLDFGTMNAKFMHRLGLNVTAGTSSTTTSGATVTVNVAWTDDDYATFSTAVGLIFGGTLNFPFITQLGMFRRRAFKLTYASTLFLRLKSIEVDINKGQQ